MKVSLKNSLVITSLAASLFVGGCSGKQNSKEVKPEKKKEVVIDVKNMDLKVKPGENFNLYANGGWKKSNPVPADKSRYGSFDALRESNRKKMKSLIKDITSNTHKDGSNGQKVADFYIMGMDTAKIEKDGTAPLKSWFEEINSIKSVKDINSTIIRFHNYGIGSLFYFGGSPDKKDSNMVIANLYQGGLGLSNRDYYVTKDKRAEEIRKAYVDHMSKMFELMGQKKDKAAESAKSVMAFETRLAEASMTLLERRNPHKTYNKTDIAGVEKLCGNFDWKSYFNGTVGRDPGAINVAQQDFFKEVDKMLKGVKVEEWKTYLTWKLLDSTANYLNKAFVDQNFAFYGKMLSGQQEMQPRWKRVQGATGSALPEVLGQLYVEKYFPPEAKKRMVQLVENLRVSLGNRISKLEWMSEETKKKAQEKLDTINVKIGYPDKWKDYSSLKIEKDSYVQNVLRGRNFRFKDNVSKVGKPMDKTQWFMPPQMVNAYYSPNLNEICFPAGILEPPFFYLNADDAVNYGAIGVVIGHEMTHGFDDQGRLFDKDGNLKNWWTKEDSEKFNKRTKVLVDQFNKFVVQGEVHADGKLTLGENIADLGGLLISYDAFMAAQKKNPQAEKIEGFTPEQRFYLSYAHVWAQNVTPKQELKLTKEDVHSLGRFRVNGPLPNIPSFHKAFGIKEGDKLYLKEEERASIW